MLDRLKSVIIIIINKGLTSKQRADCEKQFVFIYMATSKGKALAKHSTITLKSGEVITAGKKYREKKSHSLKSWGDEFGKKGFVK